MLQQKKTMNKNGDEDGEKGGEGEGSGSLWVVRIGG